MRLGQGLQLNRVCGEIVWQAISRFHLHTHAHLGVLLFMYLSGTTLRCREFPAPRFDMYVRRCGFRAVFSLSLSLSLYGSFMVHQAVVIISILLQFLNKIDRQELKPAVWKGAFTGMFGAIAVGIAFIIAFYEAGEQFFTGRTEYIVEAILVSETFIFKSDRLPEEMRNMDAYFGTEKRRLRNADSNTHEANAWDKYGDRGYIKAYRLIVIFIASPSSFVVSLYHIRSV